MTQTKYLEELNKAVLAALAVILQHPNFGDRAFAAVEVYLQMLMERPELSVKSHPEGFESMLLWLLNKLHQPDMFVRTSNLYLLLYTVPQLQKAYLTFFVFSSKSFVTREEFGSTLIWSYRLKLAQMIIKERHLEGLPWEQVTSVIRNCVGGEAVE